MLLDNFYITPSKIEVFIVINNGQMEYKSRKAKQTVEHDISDNTFFPISKERK